MYTMKAQTCLSGVCLLLLVAWATYGQATAKANAVAGQPKASAPRVAGPAFPTEWPNYGNDPAGMRYSPLTQINRENVTKLKVAWVFHTGDMSDGKDSQGCGGRVHAAVT